MKIQEIIAEDISQRDLWQIERFVDGMWKRLGIDVEFTRHFIDRINDERNGNPITPEELILLFKKEYESNGRNIAQLKDVEAVMKDLTSQLNLPFVLKGQGQDKRLIAKTIMRKPDFRTPNPQFVVK